MVLYYCHCSRALVKYGERQRPNLNKGARDVTMSSQNTLDDAWSLHMSRMLDQLMQKRRSASHALKEKFIVLKNFRQVSLISFNKKSAGKCKHRSE